MIKYKGYIIDRYVITKNPSHSDFTIVDEYYAVKKLDKNIIISECPSIRAAKREINFLISFYKSVENENN